MRWLVWLAAGCSFKGGPSIAADGPVLDDAGREIVTWRLDTAADFARPGASLGDTGVETWGSLTSAGYLPGGAVVRGVAAVLWPATTPDGELAWSALEGATIAGTGVARTADLDSFTGVAQFGVSPGAYSLAIEGEVLLEPPGQHLFALTADDIGFLELAPPGGDAYVRVTVARGAGAPSPYEAAVAGWHRFRIGFSATGASQLQLRHRAAGASVLAPLDRAHVRGRGEGLRGLQRTIFSEEMLATSREVVGVDQRAMLQTSFAPPLPGTPNPPDHWSARWAGQLYAAVPGSYQLNVVSDNGNQLRLADKLASDHWNREDSQQPANANVTATLATGWHPIVVDFNEVTGSNTIALLLKSSPDPALTNDMPIPLDRLRPVETGERAAAAFDDSDSTIVSGNTDPATRATSNVAFVMYPGETLTGVEVTVRASGPHFQDLGFEVLRPDGTALALPAPNRVGPEDLRVTWHVTNPTFLAGAAVTGTWRVRVFDNDNSPGNTGDGTLREAYVTLRTTAGHPAVAADAYWTSELIDLEARPLLDVTSVTWVGRTPRDPADIELQLRACASESCDGEAWSAPIANGGAPALAEGRRYLQARVRLRSDGARETELERLEIVYRRPGS